MGIHDNLKLLRLRFGELPAAVVARVEAAEVPELDVLGPAPA